MTISALFVCRLERASGELQQLRAEAAAREAELREARGAEREAAGECERLQHQLASERLRLKVGRPAAHCTPHQPLTSQPLPAALPPKALEAAQLAPASLAKQEPASRSAAQRLATYRLCVRTTAGLAGGGTRLPVHLELGGSRGSTGPLLLGNADGASFGSGAADVFQVEAEDVGEPQELRVWLEPAAGGAQAARWHLHAVEVQRLQPGGSSARPAAGVPGAAAYFACSGWLDASNGHSVVLEARAQGAAAAERRPASAGQVQYRCTAQLAEVHGQLSPGSLQLALFGSRGEGGQQDLDFSSGWAGAQGPAVSFISAPDVGRLLRCRIGLSSQGGCRPGGAHLLAPAACCKHAPSRLPHRPALLPAAPQAGGGKHGER